MKKKILILSTILLLMGAGCSFQSNQSSIMNDSFDKKKVCASYYQDMYDEQGMEMNGLGFYVTEIFYSPTRNSCMYVTEHILNEGDGYASYSLFDFFSKENVEEVRVIGVINREIEKEVFDALISKYKN